MNSDGNDAVSIYMQPSTKYLLSVNCFGGSYDHYFFFFIILLFRLFRQRWTVNVERNQRTEIELFMWPMDLWFWTGQCFGLKRWQRDIYINIIIITS